MSGQKQIIDWKEKTISVGRYATFYVKKNEKVKRSGVKSEFELMSKNSVFQWFVTNYQSLGASVTDFPN